MYETIILYIFIVLISIIYVEFIGYLAHRYVVHDGYFGDKIRATHFCHHEIRYPIHDFESENYRIANDILPWILTFIFSMFIPLTFLYYYKRISYNLTILLFMTSAIHVSIISYIHDSYHIKGHWLNKYEWYKYNKKCHYVHHLDNVNYGITNYCFDKLFGTFSDKICEKKDVFNGLQTTCEDRYKFLDGLPSLAN